MTFLRQFQDSYESFLSQDVSHHPVLDAFLRWVYL